MGPLTVEFIGPVPRAGQVGCLEVSGWVAPDGLLHGQEDLVVSINVTTYDAPSCPGDDKPWRPHVWLGWHAA